MIIILPIFGAIVQVIIKRRTLKFDAFGIHITISHYKKGTSAIKVISDNISGYGDSISGYGDSYKIVNSFGKMLIQIFSDNKGDGEVNGIDDYTKQYGGQTTSRVKFIINDVDIDMLTEELDSTLRALKLIVI